MSLGTRAGATKHAKGCWTCKRRKIGCDKTQPSCSNCVRTKRFCEGYGLKLAWPEDGDGRRPDSIICRRSPDFFLPATRDEWHFLNTSGEDLIEGAKRPLQLSALSRWQSVQKHSILSIDLSRGLKFGYEITLDDNEGSLLSYYNEVLSRMITTIDDSKNGFRTVLLPVALSETHEASAGLRQALFALAACHLWGTEAGIKYKLSAIRLLSRSLQNGEDAATSQFATMMMLCCCDVFTADWSWPQHLAGAKAIGSKLTKYNEYDDSIKFLQTWLEYHDVLASFSAGGSRSELSNTTEIILEPSETAKESMIIGALGCSRELMNLIALTTRLHKLLPLPAHLESAVASLRMRLDSIDQIPLLSPDQCSGPLSTARILQTAELYRLAALIYLYTTLMKVPRSSPVLQSFIEQSLSLMEDIGLCTSPWPLFVTAIEVDSGEDRVRVFTIMETMQRERRIGNIDVLQKVVEVVWKRIDLRSDVGSAERVEWRDLFDMSERMPSFI